MSDGLKIRRATAADLPTLLKFEQLVIEAERPFDPTLKDSDVKYYDLDAMLADQENVLLALVEYEGEVIATGYARLEKAKQRYKFDRYAYLGFMCVSPSLRGRAVIQKLLNFLKEWVYSKGVKELRLHVYMENSSAIHAYEKFGFTPYMQEMRFEIEEL